MMRSFYLHRILMSFSLLMFSNFIFGQEIQSCQETQDLALVKTQSPYFESCKNSYDEAFAKGVQHVEIERARIDDYKIEPKFLDLARSQHNLEQHTAYAVSLGTYIALIGVPATFIWHYKIGYQPDRQNPDAPATWNYRTAIAFWLSTISGSFFLGQALNTPMLRFFDILKAISDGAWNWRSNAPKPWNAQIEIIAAKLKYHSIRRKYEEAGTPLPAAYIHIIEDRFDHLETQYINKAKIKIIQVEEQGDRQTVMKSLKMIERTLALPQAPKEVIVDYERLQELTNNYPEGGREKLEMFAESIAHWSKPRKNGQNRPSRQVLYLQGASGTGKTHFIENFTQIFSDPKQTDPSKNRGLPIIHIPLEGSDLQGLIGLDAGDSSDWDKVQNISKLSAALSSLAEDQRFNNAIIVLDEADKFLNGENGAAIRGYLTKEIFNLNTKKIKLHDLGVEVDISGYHFVLIGNAPIYDPSNAFMDRMTVVKFGAFTEDKRINIACNEFGRGTSQIENFQLKDEYLEHIIAGAQRDQQIKPGVRSLLQTVNQYVDHLSVPKRSERAFDFLKHLDTNSQEFFEPYSMYEMMEQKYNRIKENLSPGAQAIITKGFERIKSGHILNEALRPGNTEAHTSLKTFIANLGAMLRVPQTVKNLTEQEESIKGKVQELLRLYPKEVRKKIEDVVKVPNVKIGKT